MFEPRYDTTYFLIGCIEKIAAARALVTRTRTEEDVRAALEREMFERSVHSSTKIEGNRLSLEQVAALHAGDSDLAAGKDRTEVENAIAAMHWMLRKRHVAMTEADLCMLHAKMTKGLLPKERSGNYRTVQNYIVDGRGQIIETPPAPKHVAKRMKALFVWLTKNTALHPIVRSAIFHHEFVTVHPFVDGNGRTVRAAAQWILGASGYEPSVTLGLDEFFANDRRRYYDMIQETHGIDGDYTQWIEYVAEGLVYAADRAGVQKRHVLEQVTDGYTGKQQELLVMIKHSGLVGSAELCERMGVNRARMHEILSPLVEAGAVVKIGKARATRYRYVIS
jgi:Fic family protein